MKGRTPTKAELAYWSRLVDVVGCVACRIDGYPTYHCSIHHIVGRTKPGAHMNVLPLCAGHHQDGTGENKTLIAVHPYKARFEAKYGKQAELKAYCDRILEEQERANRPCNCTA